jgi:phospholipid-binding lipoprotein MlaA
MQKSIINTRLLAAGLIISGMLGGCATTPKTGEANANDPLEGWNRGAQSFNDDVDDVILKPMAKGYLWITSDAVDEGVSNFFSNLNDIGVTVNDLLQFKMLQAGMDASRFLINTTAGVVGVFDVAKHIDLPKHDEDFGQTLGYWGIPSGPYLVLPFAGASSPRDAVGLRGDALLSPLTYAFLLSGGMVNAVSLASSAVDVADTRAGLMSTEKMIDEAAVDRYEFIKNSYQQHREFLVNDGSAPSQEADGFDIDKEVSEMEDIDNASTDAAETNAAGNASANTARVNAVTAIPDNTVKITPIADRAPVATHTLKLEDPKPAVSPKSVPVTRHFLDLSAHQEE